VDLPFFMYSAIMSNPHMCWNLFFWGAQMQANSTMLIQRYWQHLLSTLPLQQAIWWWMHWWKCSWPFWHQVKKIEAMANMNANQVVYWYFVCSGLAIIFDLIALEKQEALINVVIVQFRKSTLSPMHWPRKKNVLAHMPFFIVVADVIIIKILRQLSNAWGSHKQAILILAHRI